MNEALRHRCRNLKCHTKLKEPIGNEHKAFCCRGCFESFYRAKCIVCEKDIGTDPLTGEKRKRLGQRKFCGRKCRAEASQFPHVYAWVLPDPVRPTHSSRSAHFTGLKFGLEGHRPIAHSLRGWWWGGDGQGDHSLYDRDGLTIARVVQDDDRYRLRTPVVRLSPGVRLRDTWHLEWPSLEKAKHGAESFALMAMPLASVDPKLAARIKRDNASPHPMGPPLERPSSSDVGTVGASTKLAFKTSGSWSDDLAIPEFLRRRRP
jgi:hypothetical protein